MNSLEEKRRILGNFITMCKTASGDDVPEDLGINDISKMECSKYPTQEVEIIKIFFRTKGSRSNNKPYTCIEELPNGTYSKLTEYLFDTRTSNSDKSISSIFATPMDRAENIEIYVPEELRVQDNEHKD